MRPIYLISQTPYPGVLHIPILKIRFLTPDIDFSAYHGLVFTSKQAVKSLEPYSESWKRLPCMCVSEATAIAVRNAGGDDIRMADGYGKSIPESLSLEGSGGKWLYLRPKVIASEWVETAREQGIEIDEAIMYETVCNKEGVFSPIESNGVLIFTSPSSIDCFMARYEILPDQKIVVIGKTTQKRLPKGVDATLSDSASVASCVKIARTIANY
ncbi:MAG: uroporphyrinogen-III synthase [Sulfuricurvum sp.]|uniref:uroporphyrinogen-III synthase n=1 Tax=Sulfuricurvum sp. TaxID=2025608 RepID=UPI0025D1839F|nr:uroporphyrinogen-III synthase [Sulfuricurvum sp.]MCK9371783.1 uroporphyrinogen-III synthase [Sulfuricurvum sp.]